MPRLRHINCREPYGDHANGLRSFGEIGREMGMPASTVRLIFHRAMRKLRSQAQLGNAAIAEMRRALEEQTQ